ncbi:DUF3114 domain-containing protein [Vagococcus xieshaowenii]|uniref:DUF3114 domain-containing protein n=1 Tax=Vagococcus xieshaowenii TaxID=2562451 RepID=A0A4Z0D4Z8_9ENTE|nr:DUF3114 domain-containing protein [Vagococcus xieshaowenii]QCA28123.1 DUF3114 domain-containing protein [Vagococcus xieshaowenii]TFZ40166.1 DUF3114 domain-containing protein [Vagococcus xieshaowenii]
MASFFRRYILGIFRYRYRLTVKENQLLEHYHLIIQKIVCEQRGWDEKARAYFVKNCVKKYLTANETLSLDKVIQTELNQSLRVGTTLYYKMYKKSSLSTEKKIALLLNQMGAEIDNHGMLQLTGTHTFDVKMAPHGKFLHYFSKLVQRAYGREGLKDKRLHQFRIYIDEHNIRYIRSYFKLPSMNDEQALQLYVTNPKKSGGLGGRKLIAERGRFHNKSKRNAPRTSENRKRLCPNFHGEFIIDDEGEFVSQWNVLHRDFNHRVVSDWQYYQTVYRDKLDYFEEQIINGESFNYASWNGKIHRQLDVYPTRRLDYPIRRKIAKKWRSPGLKEYKWRQKDRAKTKYYRRGF